MEERDENKGLSRRELLKKGLVTTGYVIPAVMMLKMGALDAWASNYHNTNMWENSNKHRRNKRHYNWHYHRHHH